MKHEPTWIACMRPEDMTGPPYPGSTKEECDSCGTEIWSDPAMRQVVRERHGEPTLICWKCAGVSPDEPGFTEQLRDSLDILRESLGRKN